MIKIRPSIFCFLLSLCFYHTYGQTVAKDSVQKSGKEPKYKFGSENQSFFSQPKYSSPFYLGTAAPPIVNFNFNPNSGISLDPSAKSPIGLYNYRIPENLSIDQYSDQQTQNVYRKLLKQYASALDGQSDVSGRGLKPKILKSKLFDELLGQNIDLNPTGFVSVEIGAFNQKSDNPMIPLNLRNNTQFVFNQQASFNLNGGIGDLMKINTNFDTKAAFNFQNQLKLNYRAQEEDIVQNVEAGNVNFPLPTTLIAGVNNLFGVKTNLRFGKLDMSLVASQQRSKTESIYLKGGKGGQGRGGGQEIRCDNYDENRNFFLSHFFRDNYERWLNKMPIVLSGVNITRVEVYVTNRSGNTETLRNIAGFSDMAELRPFNPSVVINNTLKAADNKANDLFQKVKGTSRQVDAINSEMAAFGLNRGTDYDLLRGAKRLTDREYNVNRELGYVSLLSPLKNDEILLVAYEYTYQGRQYKVGELTEDYQNRKDDEVLFLKMLKSSTIRNNLTHPMWDLMMKNVYSLNVSGLQKEGFQMRIIYKDDKSGLDNPNLQEGARLKDRPLVRLLKGDQLNKVLDPQPDGNFDFVENVTIDSRFGRIIFPVLEPFGNTLRGFFNNDEQSLIDKYVFDELYDKTLADAQQITRKTKFFLRGSYQGGAGGGFGGEVQTNGLTGEPVQTGGGFPVQLPFGVDENTVVVSAGGVPLSRGSDYQVDAAMGQVRIMNQSIMSSGREIRIDYERPDLFSNQIRSMIGGRFDYNLSKDVHLGATVMKYRETPSGFLRRVAVGNEPNNNTIIGFDANIRRPSQFLTKMVDALPLLQTKEISQIDFQGEVAQLFPGVAPRVNGNSFIDDFEGSRTVYDLARQGIRWKLGATPTEFMAIPGDNFQLKNADRRAKISAYNIDLSFFGGGGGQGVGVPSNFTQQDQANVFERNVSPAEVYKGRDLQNQNIVLPLTIFDVAYFPKERGAYNYTTNLENNGLLKDPKKNFGAITRAIPSDIDFDNSNIEILEFWLLDPFPAAGVNPENYKVKDGIFNKVNETGGKLEIHLGDISEDLIPDGKYNFENGLPAEFDESRVSTSLWGFAPKQQFVTNAFDTRAGSREGQDVGLDGMNNQFESERFKTTFLDLLPNTLTTEAKTKISNDPSGDDYRFFFSEEFANDDNPNHKLVYRYKDALGMENNSPPMDQSRQVSITEAGTNLPDNEDLNNDNTVNDIESYYKYTIDLKPGRLKVGEGFAVDKVDNGERGTWYLMRIPLRTSNKEAVNNINGFKSIRFMRMLMTDFEEPVVLRFGQLQLTSFQYRKYDKDLFVDSEKPGIESPEVPSNTQFKVSSVSIEENADAGTETNATTEKTAYRVPPGFERDRDITTFNNVQLNEQSLSLCVDNLKGGDARAVFKNTAFDLLSYKNLRMFLSLSNSNTSSIIDNKVNAFIRLGTDLNENYYEIEKINLTKTKEGLTNPTPEEVWPEANEINIPFEELRKVKINRDGSSGAFNAKYSELILGGTYKITIVGRPDLSSVQSIMLGVRNNNKNNEPISFCVWMNELRVNGFDQTAGFAAIGKVNLKLADFAQVTMTGAMKTFGFGGVQQRISERNRDVRSEFGISSNILIDKLFPMKWNLSIPLFVSYDNSLISPFFDPLDPDMRLRDALVNKGNDYRRITDDKATRRGFNFSNVRKSRGPTQDKAHIYDIENFAFSYAFNAEDRYSVMVAENSVRSYRGGITYTYQNTPKAWEPFAKSKGLERPSLALIKDFNLSLAPTSVMIRADMDRSFVKTRYRNDIENDPEGLQESNFYEKYFLFNRMYDVNWNLSKSLIFNYNATANAVIDEPLEAESPLFTLDPQFRKDSIIKNLWRLGRPKLFAQNLSATWRVPLDKLPISDWMTADYSWKVGVNYAASPFGLRDNFDLSYGNTIQNARDQQVTGKIDLVMLYNKLKYLKFANSPAAKKVVVRQNPGAMEDVPESKSQVLKKFTRALLAIRGINYTIGMQETTILPGFMPAPKYVGLGKEFIVDSTGRQTVNAWAPGLPFVLGSQNINILDKAKNNNWLTRSTEQNLPFIQTRNKRIEFRTQIEPFDDLQIQLEARWNRADNYQEFYRVGESGQFESITPSRSGNFSMSYLSFLTAFKLNNRDGSSDNFNTFLAYRNETIKRYEGNAEGYNKNSQDVLIPAFFAAYSGQDPAKVKRSAFRGVPLPNWRANYKGLTNLKPFSKWFSTFEINHAYSSTYSVGNFVSSLEYAQQEYINSLRFNSDFSRVHFIGFDNAFNKYIRGDKTNEEGNSIPIYMMSIVSFTEKFGPFVGINFRTKSQWTGKVEYNQDRNISLNLSNSSVSELINKDWVVSFGATKKNMRLPFKVNGKSVKLENDVIFNINFTLRDQIATLRKISPDNDLDKDSVPTSGQFMLQFRPQVQYAVSNNFSVSIYFDRMLNDPYVLTSFRRATTQGGIQLRYSLGE